MMSHLLDRLQYLKKTERPFSKDHGVMTDENRKWEDAYRHRWQHDKIVRSTHGVNCTGSCSWKIYVKKGLITWETQQTDYPRTRPGLPNHEPRGCQRGASYSWYIYSAGRLKYPLVRGRLLQLWRQVKAKYPDPVVAWGALINDKKAGLEYKEARGQGGFVRATWNEINEVIAASNIHTIKEYGPDRVIGFSPIPAMSMVSYAAGSRYLSLIGGVCLSFYDWYCDLPPSSPQTWGEQTDVPESADWYNSSYILAWGSNVPQTRTPDAHFFTESRYNGTKTVAITPDYSEVAKLCDVWIHPKQGTDSALAMAMGHVILKEYHLTQKCEYFNEYCRQYTDMPFLVRLIKKGDYFIPDRFIRASDFTNNLKIENNPDWQEVLFDELSQEISVPNGTLGSRWGTKGKWNLELKDVRDGREIKPLLSLIDHDKHDVLSVAFPYFGNQTHDHFTHTAHPSVLHRNIPAISLSLAEGKVYVATVFDLLLGNYGLDRQLGGDNVASSYDDDVPYTPRWQENITGVPRNTVITIAREFAENAAKTNGRSMIIVGAALNHWYHMDMTYRSIINMLIMCGCVGQSGGGWSHYVGQEKLRPQTGWVPLAFASDWVRPSRQMNGTSFFYLHTSQWRYEYVPLDAVLSPLADSATWKDLSFLDCNYQSVRMGWLPTAPQLNQNSIKLAGFAQSASLSPAEYVIKELKAGTIKFACSDPDNSINFPRVLFVWRSNLLGSSGKGHEYFLKYLLGTTHGVLGKDLGEEGLLKPKEVVWRDAAHGKLDLLVTLDFRMSTTCMYSDIVLPTATWYEKNDLNTSDMHPFIHPLSAAIDSAWESRSDWEIYKGIARTFSLLCHNHLGKEQDVVLTPIMHDTAQEMAQPYAVKDWLRNECDPIPGVTMPAITVVERDYPNTYKKFTAIGPLLSKLGNGGKGIQWQTSEEVQFLGELNRTVTEDGITKGMPRIESDIDAAEMILSLAPETNGQVAVKAWEALSVVTGLDHTHLARAREEDKIRFRDVQAQPRKIISSPTWSGIESEHVSYNAGYTNVHELIPWRTLTGRQELYQDHPWMQAFGVQLCLYRPPLDLKSVHPAMKKFSNSKRKTVVLNFITPHQKWGIHSTYSDNLIMLTLNRGGPIIWISEVDAQKIGIVDNDWIEAFNVNGAICARAVVSQRVPEGMSLMYHAQEKILNVPLSELTKARGGIHNSVTRIMVNPTHMIGGYGQLSYGFNYYGTVGSNRDEFIIVRKMENVTWD